MSVSVGDGGVAAVRHLLDLLVQKGRQSFADIFVRHLLEHAGRDPGEVVEVEAGRHGLADQAAVRVGLRKSRPRKQQPTRLPSASAHGDLESRQTNSSLAENGPRWIN